MIQQSSSLVLKTSDISTVRNDETASAECGSWSNYKQSQRFHVNMRDCIGSEIYDAHDMFLLRLNSVSWTACDPALTVFDRQCVVRMSGLPWVNSTYSIKNKANSNVYDLCVVNITPDENKTLYFSQNISMAQFTKGSDQVTIQMDLVQTLAGAPVAWGGGDAFPHFVFLFDIYPI